MIDGRWPGRVERSMNHLYEVSCEAYDIYDDVAHDVVDDDTNLPRHHTVTEILDMVERVQAAVNVLQRACKSHKPSEQHFLSQAQVMIRDAYEMRHQLHLLAGIGPIREGRLRRRFARKERKEVRRQAIASREQYTLDPETRRLVLDGLVRDRQQELERRRQVLDSLIQDAQQDRQELDRRMQMLAGRVQESQEELQDRLQRRARVLDIIYTARSRVMQILNHTERAIPQCKGGRRRLDCLGHLLTGEGAAVFMQSVHVIVLALELLSEQERNEGIWDFLREFHGRGRTILRSLNFVYCQCQDMLGEDAPPVPRPVSDGEESTSSVGVSVRMDHDVVLPVEWRTDRCGVSLNTGAERR
jgi:hypothetical protein